MSERDDGPVPQQHNPEMHPSGVTLRDWFAGLALTGALLDDECTPSRNAAAWAKEAYELADAMLAARAKSIDRK